MSGTVTHQMMMLRPMQAGLSGYARLQGETGRQLVQINLRGMQDGEMRVFWYAGEGLVREVGRCPTNLRGEATLSAEIPMDAAAPRRLMALLITDGGDRPRPLAIGLCTAQSAGSLMDAKNALLALCDKLTRVEEEKRTDHENLPANTEVADKSEGASSHNQPGSHYRQAKADASETTVIQREMTTLPDKLAEMKTTSEVLPAPSGSKQENHPGRHGSADLPREVFLPAIEARTRPERRRTHCKTMQSEQQQAKNTERLSDPTEFELPDAKPHPRPSRTANHSNGSRTTPAASEPAMPPAASAKPSGIPQPAKPDCQPMGRPADRLPVLQWPAPFQSLAVYFAHNQPLRLMNWPSWRFVSVPESKLWIGYSQQDGRVRQVAYALPADAPTPEGQPFRMARTAAGEEIQLLVLDA